MLCTSERYSTSRKVLGKGRGKRGGGEIFCFGNEVWSGSGDWELDIEN